MALPAHSVRFTVRELDRLLVQSEKESFNQADRIEAVYSVYQYAKNLLNSTEFANLKSDKKKHVNSVAARSFEFLMTVFAIGNDVIHKEKALQRRLDALRSHGAKHERLRMFVDSSYQGGDTANRIHRFRKWIPGNEAIKPASANDGNDLISDASIRYSRARANWTLLSRMVLAQKRGNILSVNEKRKLKDQARDVRYLSPVELEKMSIYISPAGLFVTHDSNNKFTNVSTLKKISHGKINFNAIVVNLNGDMILFQHLNMTDRIAHSSMAFQRSVFFAGEVEIVKGKLITITLHSGHYRPTFRSLYLLLKRFQQQGVDLSVTKINGTQNALEFIRNAEEYLELDNKTYREIMAPLKKNLMALGLRNLTQAEIDSIQPGYVVRVKECFESFFHQHYDDMNTPAVEKAKSMLESILLKLNFLQFNIFIESVRRDLKLQQYNSMEVNQVLLGIVEYIQKLRSPKNKRFKEPNISEDQPVGTTRVIRRRG